MTSIPRISLALCGPLDGVLTLDAFRAHRTAAAAA